jgi:hypothetical protein
VARFHFDAPSRPAVHPDNGVGMPVLGLASLDRTYDVEAAQ